VSPHIGALDPRRHGRPPRAPRKRRSPHMFVRGVRAAQGVERRAREVRRDARDRREITTSRYRLSFVRNALARRARATRAGDEGCDRSERANATDERRARDARTQDVRG